MNSRNTASTVESKIRLLLVDDDEVDRENAIRMLAKQGTEDYCITLASDFQEAMKILSEQSFDICLVDYYLGDHTGLDLLELVKANHPKTSVIMLTGLDDSFIDDQALNAGVFDFLDKNELSPKSLGRAIRYALYHKNMALEREHLAHHDSLTQLVNRSLFFDRLAHLTKQSQRYDTQHAVLYIDLDYFKTINDQYGHHVGDAVLKIFSERLVSSVREVDTVARLGGDEFAIILEQISLENTDLVAQKILGSAKQPFVIGDLRLIITPSIGVTVFPNEDNDPQSILKQADKALYHAKESGRQQYRHFDKTLRTIAEEEAEFESSFLAALNSRQIFPVYQPQYDFNDNKIIGFEALARWRHPTGRNISPGEFIPHAEKLALMPTLTEAILKRACCDAAILSKTCPDFRMAINISASECSNTRLVNMVKEAISEFDIKPSQLELEVTESVLITHPETSIETLQALHGLGVRIAIDDFGTGYSSLSYLTELPIDTLKVDMSFVGGIGMNRQKEVVIQVIIDLAKRLELKVVAEGVEKKHQAEFLISEGCDYVQGYLYSHPRSFNECRSLFSESTGLSGQRVGRRG